MKNNACGDTAEVISERLDRAKALAETAQREIQGIFDNAPFGICFTYERKVVRYNRAFGEMFGFAGDSGLGQPARVLFHSDDDYAEIGRRAGPLLSQNLPFEHELLLLRQTGESFWTNLKAYPADLNDPSVGTVWLLQDHTAVKAAEADIVKSAEEMTAIFEASTFGIAFIKDRVMLKANRKLEEIFGYAAGELHGQPTRCWYIDEESYRSVGEAYAELARGQTHRRVLPLRRKGGSPFQARLNGVALAADVARGSVWTVEDITAEYQANAATLAAKEQAEATEARLRDSYAELKSANQRLQQLDELKSDFLSAVSHELRTPLTSIRGFASLVEREFSRSFAPLAANDAALARKAARIGDNLAIILKESERLTRLINDVLDLAKIEAGRVDWHDGQIDAIRLIDDAVAAARGMFDAKPAVALRLDLVGGLPTCFGDADKLQQVLLNLLGNAVKFTERGSVTLHAAPTADGGLRIEVRDSGIGFPPEEAEAIFDKFQQSNHGDTLVDRPKGTGLGLAISREIAVRHGGRLWANSAAGQGSVFTLTLPPASDVAATAGLPTAAAETPDTRKL